MEFGNLSFQKIEEKFRIKSPWDLIIIFVLNILITIPVFIIAHHNFITLFHLLLILFLLLIVE
jgi:hypothetical protein